jgi:hypothetical protein
VSSLRYEEFDRTHVDSNILSKSPTSVKVIDFKQRKIMAYIYRVYKNMDA